MEDKVKIVQMDIKGDPNTYWSEFNGRTRVSKDKNLFHSVDMGFYGHMSPAELYKKHQIRTTGRM